VQAEDGEQAWALLEDGLRPDVCCCDVVMPRLDGLGLLARTRAHPILKDLPFVLISSAADRETVQTAIAGGVAGYILKPFLAVQTRGTVERVVRERRAGAAEHFLVTRRRLAVDLEQLLKLLEKLRGDASQCEQALGDPSSTDTVRTGWLQRLHSGTMVLGLTRAATLVKDVLGDGAAAQSRALVVQEVGRLVDEQLREVRQLTPPVAV
jgi:two-component system chemotaxis response regulator CheY